MATSLGVLALPLLATSGAGALFQLIDLALVSRLGEEATTAVIVTNQSLRQAVLMLVMGASFGAQGLVARHVGEGRIEDAEHVTGQVILLGAGFAGLTGLLGVVFAEPLLASMQVSDRVLAIGVPYVRLVFLLHFAFVFVLLGTSLLSGAGDATTPFMISLLQAPIALFAEWCLIFGHLGAPALGVRGVALGLGIGQLAGLTICLRVLFGGRSRVHLRVHHLAPDPHVLRRIVSLAWPPALHLLGSFLVTVFFIRLIGGFGSTAQTAYSIGLRLGMIGPMLAMPLAGACSTLVAQNLGAGRLARAWRGLALGLATHAGLLWCAALVLFLFRSPIVASFSGDPEVVRIGSQMLAFQAGTFAAWGLYFVFFRVLQGAGDVRVPMWISLINSLLVTLPLGSWLASGWGLGLGPVGVFAATLVGSVTVTVATGIRLVSGRWTRGVGRRETVGAARFPHGEPAGEGAGPPALGGSGPAC